MLLILSKAYIIIYPHQCHMKMSLFIFCSDKQLITILIYDRRNTIFIQVTANDTGQIIGRFIGAVSRTDVYLYRGNWA